MAMKVTKNNIIKAVNKATGISPELSKINGEYYWCGVVSALFSEGSTGYSTLTHPNITIQTFVVDFKDKIKSFERNYQSPIKEALLKIEKE
jgi:hypothetical protein